MNEKFREVRTEELKTGTAVWFHGKSFLNTSSVWPPGGTEKRPICGPFLIQRVMFGGGHIQEPRVDLINPATGDRRSMMRSWLLVPMEQE